MRPTSSRLIPESVPERRRVIVIGASEAGVTAAFRLGESSYLLEQQNFSGEHRDQPNDFEMGNARHRAMGRTEADSHVARQGITKGECEALREASRGDEALTDVRRWVLPQLRAGGPAIEPEDSNGLLRRLGPLLMGRVRLGAVVTQIDTHQHCLNLENGERFVYDKLICSLSVARTQRLIVDEIPKRIFSAQSWRYWLSARDIELVDRYSRSFYGDPDGCAAGKRVAENIRVALAKKYSPKSSDRVGRDPLFQPSLVHNGIPA